MDEPGPSSEYYRRFAAREDGPILPPQMHQDPFINPSQTPVQFLDNQANDGLYAVLNVERDASPTEIKDRYRSLAARYHPDKQQDDQRRLAAHQQFQNIQRAYEVLTDPGRRTVYDMFGEEGLRTSWEVGPKNMSASQMRSFFLRQGEAKRQMDAEQLVNSKGDMSIVLDARAVFVPRGAFKNPDKLSHTPWARIQRVRPGQILGKHSWETPINETTQFAIEGVMAARGHNGGANISGTVKHQFSPRLWGQFTQAFLAPRIATAKGTYTFDENTYVTGQAFIQTLAGPPRMSMSLGRRLYMFTTGFITFNTGFWELGPWGRDMDPRLKYADQSSMMVGMTNADNSGSGWTWQLQTGHAENGIAADWTTSVMGLRVKLGGQLDVSGELTAFADAMGRVTEYTRAGATIQLATSGVQLKLYLRRLGQKITIPILLSADLNPYVVLGTAVLPAVSWAAAYHFWVLPKKQRDIKNRIQELREEHAEYIAQKKQEAENAVLLMGRNVSSLAAKEKERGGLVVLSAQYGPSSAFSSKGVKQDEAVIDVTIPIQALVQNSKLYIPGGRNKFNLMGFWDPCIGENKKLRVRYLFRDVVHEVEVDDVTQLRAPVKAHALEQ